jgi:hypothetical protein
MNTILITRVAEVIVALVVAVAAFYVGRWRGNQRQAGQPSGNQAGQPSGEASGEGTPFAYRLVLFAIMGVIAAFLVVMLGFAAFGIFKEGDAANAAAALSALFGIIGTLVGAYFGIKTSSSAQDRLGEQATATTEAATTTTQAALTAVGQRAATEENLLAAIQNLHAAWNAGNEEATLGFFADNANVTVTITTDTPPQHYTAKEEIRRFVQGHMHSFQVDSRNYRQDGSRVVWESTVSAEKFRQRGTNPAEGTAVATFAGTTIASLTFTFSPGSQQREREATDRTESDQTE